MDSRRERERREGKIKEGRGNEGKQISKQFICRPNIAQHWGSKLGKWGLVSALRLGWKRLGESKNRLYHDINELSPSSPAKKVLKSVSDLPMFT